MSCLLRRFNFIKSTCASISSPKQLSLSTITDPEKPEKEVTANSLYSSGLWESGIYDEDIESYLVEDYKEDDHYNKTMEE